MENQIETKKQFSLPKLAAFGLLALALGIAVIPGAYATLSVYLATFASATFGFTPAFAQNGVFTAASSTIVRGSIDTPASATTTITNEMDHAVSKNLTFTVTAQNATGPSVFALGTDVANVPGHASVNVNIGGGVQTAFWNSDGFGSGSLTCANNGGTDGFTCILPITSLSSGATSVEIDFYPAENTDATSASISGGIN